MKCGACNADHEELDVVCHPMTPMFVKLNEKRGLILECCECGRTMGPFALEPTLHDMLVKDFRSALKMLDKQKDHGQKHSAH